MPRKKQEEPSKVDPELVAFRNKYSSPTGWQTPHDLFVSCSHSSYAPQVPSYQYPLLVEKSAGTICLRGLRKVPSGGAHEDVDIMLHPQAARALVALLQLHLAYSPH